MEEQPQIPEALEAPLKPDVPIETKTHYMDDVTYHSFADHLDIDMQTRRNQNVAEKLSFLAEWAKEQTKSDDQIQQILAIKQLMKNLGLQSYGIYHSSSDVVKKLYQYVRLDSKKKYIETQMKSLI